MFRYDPVVERADRDLSQMPPHVFLIGTNHPQFSELKQKIGLEQLERDAKRQAAPFRQSDEALRVTAVQRQRLFDKRRNPGLQQASRRGCMVG